MRGKRALLLLTALSLVLTLLAGCGNTAPDTGEKTMVIGDTTFNSENWEETVDPHRTYNGWACIRYGIGETLVRYTDSMELEPWLAKSWSNDGDRTWTIVLQDDVTFSSGRKMDAAAVKQCLEHLLENHDRAPGDTKIADMQAEGQTLTIVTSQGFFVVDPGLRSDKFKNIADFFRKVKEGGMKCNGRRVADVNMPIEFLAPGWGVIQLGKKTHKVLLDRVWSYADPEHPYNKGR